MRRWACNPDVRWTGALTNAALMDLYPRQDVFVLPTRLGHVELVADVADQDVRAALQG